MNREISVFLRRNRVQLVIAVFCILITVKQMETPFMFQYNAVTAFLFERISDDTASGGLLDLMSNLGFAYYSSLIFYFVVDYFPTRQRERAALESVKDHLAQLALHIESLFSNLLCIAGRGSDVRALKGKGEIFSELCNLQLDNGVQHWNRKIFNKSTGVLITASQAEATMPFNAVKAECEAIICEINTINNHLNADKLETEIKDMLLIISENRYINNTHHLDARVFEQGMKSMRVNCRPNDLLELLGVSIIIRSLPIEQYGCVVNVSTTRDIEDVKNTYRKMKNDHPVSVEVVERVNRMLRNTEKKNGQ